jgi:hypothetical protein
MTHEDYVGLARELLDTMRKFLRASEPGDNLIPIHKAFTVVKQTVDAADPDSEIARNRRRLEDAQRSLADIRDQRRESEERQEADRAKRERERNKQNDARAGWTGLDRNVKMGRILTAMGADALVCKQIVKRIALAYPDICVYESDIRPLMDEMIATGELEREKEARGPNCTITAKGGYRWRWRRSRAELPLQLQDLEKRLKEA